MNAIKDRWAQLTSREKALILGLGGLVGVLAALFLMVLPVLAFEGEAKARYAEALRLEALARDIEPPGVQGQSDRGLRAVVTSYADRASVPYERVTQTPEGFVQIDLGDTPHGALFTWLRKLEESEGVTVQTASLVPGEGAGTVNGRFTLRRAAG